MLTGVSAALLLKASKYLGKFKLGIGPAFDVIWFIIWDTTNNFSCTYLYIGIGIGAGLTFTPSVSSTTHGPWNPFTTEKPIYVFQFGRWADFRTVGGGNWSQNRISFETPRGVNDVSELIDTGTTLGFGGSHTWGDLYRVDGPSPFNGP